MVRVRLWFGIYGNVEDEVFVECYIFLKWLWLNVYGGGRLFLIEVEGKGDEEYLS